MKDIDLTDAENLHIHIENSGHGGYVILFRYLKDDTRVQNEIVLSKDQYSFLRQVITRPVA